MLPHSADAAQESEDCYMVVIHLGTRPQEYDVVNTLLIKNTTMTGIVDNDRNCNGNDGIYPKQAMAP